MTGIVYKSTGSWYTVKTEKGSIYSCKIKGKFRLANIKSTNPIAVGDNVSFHLETIGDETIGIISKIHPRSNYLVRKSVKLSKQKHIIAANIDQIFLLITPRYPITYTAFIDRFLITTEAYGIKTILIFNKTDIYTEEDTALVDELLAIYTKIGYTCLKISVKTRENIDEVKKLMTGKTNIFSGNSGVGKSSLINTIEPSLQLTTSEVSNQHQQGQHTTTFAEMFDLSFDAKIIDTPGIKGFGITTIKKEELANYFPEFFKLKSQCKFYNCLHINEPKCAVKKALENNEIAESRYKNYLQILEEEKENYRTDYYEAE